MSVQSVEANYPGKWLVVSLTEGIILALINLTAVTTFTELNQIPGQTDIGFFLTSWGIFYWVAAYLLPIMVARGIAGRPGVGAYLMGWFIVTSMMPPEILSFGVLPHLLALVVVFFPEILQIFTKG